jgi:hypothetical protein
MSKYDPLRDHLENLEGDEWRTSFPGVEKILGFPLLRSSLGGARLEALAAEDVD